MKNNFNTFSRSSESHVNFPIFSAEFNGGRSAKAANLLFVGFLKNEYSLESFSLIFENSSPKGFSWQNMKKSDSSVLEVNSRYLESHLLKNPRTQLQIIIKIIIIIMFTQH